MGDKKPVSIHASPNRTTKIVTSKPILSNFKIIYDFSKKAQGGRKVQKTTIFTLLSGANRTKKTFKEDEIMRKNRRWNGILVAVMVALMMVVAGCGKGTASTDDVKPDKDTVAVEEKNDTKDGDIQAEERDDEDAAGQEQQENDAAEDSEEGTERDAAEDVADSSEMNEYGIPEDLMQDLYDCVEAAVLTGYIELNGLDPSEFQWPDRDTYEGANAWSYLLDMYTNYFYNGTMYDISNLSFEKPDDNTCQLMDSVFEGMVEWGQKVPKKILKIHMMDSPLHQLFPENIDFTD